MLRNENDQISFWSISKILDSKSTKNHVKYAETDSEEENQTKVRVYRLIDRLVGWLVE